MYIFKEDNEEIIPVSNSNENYSDIYMLDISKEDITTKNITEYFDNITLLEIYPDINPLYKKIIKLSSFQFNTAISNKKNISNFISEFNNQLKSNALTEKYLDFYLNGIKISKVKVYSSIKEIKNLVSKYSFKMIR